MVITSVLLAAGLAAGLEMRRLLVIGAAILFPVPIGLLILAHSWRVAPPVPVRSAVFCGAVSGELRSGASLRQALGHAAGSVGAPSIVQACNDGSPMRDIAERVRLEFDDVGREVSSILRRLPRLGGPSAVLFDEVESVALAQADVAREVAAASAPARATAWVLLSAPVLAVGAAVSSGALGRYLGTPAQRLVAVTGLGMVVTGLLAALAVMRRAR